MTDREATDFEDTRVELVRDEIITTDSSIRIRVPPSADPKYVMRAIGVPQHDGRVQAGALDGEFTWSPLGELRPGQHRMVVEALADRDSRRLTSRLEVPFQVIQTKARIPANLRIESFVRVRLLPDGFERLGAHTLPDGEYVDVLKATNRESGAPVALYFDEQGRAPPDDSRLREHAQRLASATGKIHPTLPES